MDDPFFDHINKIREREIRKAANAWVSGFYGSIFTLLVAPIERVKLLLQT